jgi:hypothetical protein
MTAGWTYGTVVGYVLTPAARLDSRGIFTVARHYLITD